MFIIVFGGFFLLVGIMFLYVMIGIFSICEIILNVDVVILSYLFILVLVFILLGVFIKFV